MKTVIEQSVLCAVCSEELRAEISWYTFRHGDGRMSNPQIVVKVTPCETCLKDAHEEGREEKIAEAEEAKSS